MGERSKQLVIRLATRRTRIDVHGLSIRSKSFRKHSNDCTHEHHTQLSPNTQSKHHIFSEHLHHLVAEFKGLWQELWIAVMPRFAHKSPSHLDTALVMLPDAYPIRPFADVMGTLWFPMSYTLETVLSYCVAASIPREAFIVRKSLTRTTEMCQVHFRWQGERRPATFGLLIGGELQADQLAIWLQQLGHAY